MTARTRQTKAARNAPVEPLPVTEKERRIAEVASWICDGMTRDEIRAYVESDECDWEITGRAIDHYVAEAEELLGREADTDRHVQLGTAIRRLNDLYARALRIQDYKTCLAVEKARISLLGLDQVQADTP